MRLLHRLLALFKNKYIVSITLEADISIPKLEVYANGDDEIDVIIRDLRKLSKAWNFRKERSFFLNQYDIKIYLKTDITIFAENEDIVREQINKIFKKIKNLTNFYIGSTWKQKIYIPQEK